MKRLRIAASPLTGNIFAGIPLKNGVWGANKQDVTIEAIVAVAEHGLKFGKPIIISNPGGSPEFEITVRDLRS